MSSCRIIFLFLAIFVCICDRSIAFIMDKRQYASLPELFYMDNYDTCMMLGEQGFYCSFSYMLQQPLHASEMWTIIENANSIKANYRHDHLRHWICVPKTCPGVNKTHENDPKLKQALENCYDQKYETIGLKGVISQINCQEDAKYPVDWLDIFVGLLFINYITFVLYATIHEGIARYKPQEGYATLTRTRVGKVISAFSITRNWIRLKTIESTPEIEKLRAIQGIRVYNTGLVILCHTLLGFVAAPVANTRYTETMHEKNAALFFSSGPLCVATFFFISSFLLSNGLFQYMKHMNLKLVLVIFFKRIFRLTPSLLTIILFHATLLRHLGSGPNWDHYINAEYIKCRKNGWSNLLYINNWVDKSNMCLPVTWYLALDTQYFIASLFFIWFIKAYEKYVWFIIGTALSLNIAGTFLQNYYYDFTALVLPTAESYYGLNNMFNNHQFHYQICGVIGNTAGPLVGIAFGYYFNKHKNTKKPLFSTKFRTALWWLLTFVLGFGFVIITGLIILRDSIEHSAFWASLYVALSRPLLAFTIGTGVIGFTQGTGWLALRTVQWAPTYVLGRLSLSAYLVHMSVVIMRPSLVRYPLYISDFQVLIGYLGDLSLTYIAATFLTLFVEAPMTELQKYVFTPDATKKRE